MASGWAMHAVFTISPRGPGLHEFTDEVKAFVRKSGARDGVLTLFVQHTSCSIVIQENADPDVKRDLAEFFRRLAPHADQPSMSWIRHRTEGPDDMPAHLKAAVLPTSLSIPIVDSKLALGTWQGVYLFEHRDEPQQRRVAAYISA